MAEVQYDGSCLCGEIKLQASGKPKSVVFCHCKSCRKHTGAPVTVFADYKIERISFMTSGPALYESSNNVFRGFCPTCGSTMSYQSKNLPEMIHIHTGVFEDPDNFKPRQHENIEAKLPWLCVSSLE